MPFNILDELNQGQQLKWVVARVKSHDATKRKMVLVIGDPADATAPTIPGASYLQSYTPRIGDIVHALVHEHTGVLVLGTTSP